MEECVQEPVVRLAVERKLNQRTGCTEPSSHTANMEARNGWYEDQVNVSLSVRAFHLGLERLGSLAGEPADGFQYPAEARLVLLRAIEFLNSLLTQSQPRRNGSNIALLGAAATECDLHFAIAGASIVG